MSYYKFPIGCRFCPTEEDLLTSYLKNKAMGLPLPWNGVIERDLYGDQATPWEVLKYSDGWEPVVDSLAKVHPTKRVIYVITKTSNIVTDGKRKARTAGCGRWKANTAAKDIRNSNDQIIGVKRTLTFESNIETVGQWNMDEYALSGVSLEGIKNYDHVICRIKRDDSKISKGGRLVTKENSVNVSDNGVQGDAASLASTSSATENFEGFGKRKPDFEEENHHGNKVCRINNWEGTSNWQIAASERIPAAPLEIQSAVDDGVRMDERANIQQPDGIATASLDMEIISEVAKTSEIAPAPFDTQNMSHSCVTMDEWANIQGNPPLFDGSEFVANGMEDNSTIDFWLDLLDFSSRRMSRSF